MTEMSLQSTFESPRVLIEWIFIGSLFYALGAADEMHDPCR